MISARLLLGVLFIAAGVGRMYVETGGVAGHEHARGPGWPWLTEQRRARRRPRGRERGAAERRASRRPEEAAPSAGRGGRGALDRSRMILRRSIGSPILFTVVYSSLASAIYFSLGVIAGHALGLTPLVFLLAALLFTLTAMTYAEGASLHPDRGGSTVFARYAFNELVSFIAGWAILLDYIILIAVTAFSATQYLRVFWRPLGNRGEALGLALVVHRAGGAGQHPRLRRAPRAAGGGAGGGRSGAAGLHRRARDGAVLQPAAPGSTRSTWAPRRPGRAWSSR